MALFPFPNSKAWTTGDFPAPWQASRPALYTHLVDHGPEGDLPDDDRAHEGQDIRFVAGALDNLFGGSDRDPAKIVALIRKVMQNPSTRHIGGLYEVLCEDGAMGSVDGAIAQILEDRPDPDRLATFFGWLARTAPDREPVKFAIAMLGLLDGDTFRDLFLTFGAHEEFTKFAAVALGNALPEDEARAAQMQLARQVTGWGRIDLVDRLAPEGDAAFRHWLVREGFENSIMNEYLAWTAAHHGRLLEQLSTEDAATDDALLDGAADIFDALVNGGPAEDIRQYDDAVPAVERWLTLVAARPATLRRANAAQRIHVYATSAEHNWPKDTAATIAASARAYLDRPEIAEAVTEALTSGEGQDFWLAKIIAPEIGIDPWPFLYDLQRDDLDGDHWFGLMQTDDPDRIDKVLALAIERLPLDAIASGPAKEIWLGLQWAAHGALDFILQDLERHPGKGWPLIRAGLRSPVVRNRNMAIRAFKVWPRGDWPDEALHLIRDAARQEPDDDVKLRFEDLLGPRDAAGP